MTPAGVLQITLEGQILARRSWDGSDRARISAEVVLRMPPPTACRKWKMEEIQVHQLQKAGFQTLPPGVLQTLRKEWAQARRSCRDCRHVLKQLQAQAGIRAANSRGHPFWLSLVALRGLN